MSAMGSGRYGERYWCIKSTLSEDGLIYVNADAAEIRADGSLVMIRRDGSSPEINLAIAPGHWTACFAASEADGDAVAVEHWPGLVDR